MLASFVCILGMALVRMFYTQPMVTRWLSLQGVRWRVQGPRLASHSLFTRALASAREPGTSRGRLSMLHPVSTSCASSCRHSVLRLLTVPPQRPVCPSALVHCNHKDKRMGGKNQGSEATSRLDDADVSASCRQLAWSQPVIQALVLHGFEGRTGGCHLLPPVVLQVPFCPCVRICCESVFAAALLS